MEGNEDARLLELASHLCRRPDVRPYISHYWHCQCFSYIVYNVNTNTKLMKY